MQPCFSIIKATKHLFARRLAHEAKLPITLLAPAPCVPLGELACMIAQNHREETCITPNY